MSLLTAPTRPATPPQPAQGPLGRLAGIAFRNRGRTVLAWLLALGVAVGISLSISGSFTADYTTPGSDSKVAQQQLEQHFPGQAGETITAVLRSSGPISADRATVTTVLADLKRSTSHVTAVSDPFSTPGAVSADGHTAVATMRLDVEIPADMPKTDTKRLLDVAHRAQTPTLTIALGGQTVQQAEQGQIGSEGIGMAAAAIILLIMFGSVVAAGLPLLVAIAGLGVSSLLTGAIAAALPVPDWSTSLAAMMGIGIGIDYALLMVTRFREWRADGLDPEAATIATLDTAGRSVLLAGSTVVISMFGLFAMGLSFMRGAAVVTIVAVFIVMAAAITLFPALLGYFGKHIERLRLPLTRRKTVVTNGPSRGWVRWSRLVERYRIAATVLGVALLLALASPFLGVRFGFPDAGNDPAATSNRAAYDLQSAAFGKGFNAPLLLVANIPSSGDAAALDTLASTLRTTDDVAVVTPPRKNATGDTAIVTVIPKSGPQDKATEDLVHRLRDTVIPGALRGSGVRVHVGGIAAASIDTTANIAGRLPLLIGGVVLLSMVLLLVSFRSIAVAIKAALMNLLSVAAAYGVVALVLQGGWFGKLVGIDTATPLPAFIPVLMFAVLFGLSMDYEVFLVARMREAWLSTQDNHTAVVTGLASTARVITAAAAIMVAVFSAFIPSDLVFLKVIGIGMAAAIFIDATIVRMLLVPAVMHLLGSLNWWMPSALGRLVPEIHVEGHPEAYRLQTA